MEHSLKPRERVLAAMDFRPPDMIPLQISPGSGGLYEHGQKLVDLIRSCGHDFGDLSNLTLPEPPAPEDFDPDGRYHAIKTDAWGTTWEYRIFGICVQLHPDRGDLMQRGTPEQVRDYVYRLLDTFDTANGGSWLYLEIDPGFPFPNVEALFTTAMELRNH